LKFEKTEINKFLVKYYNGKCAKMVMGKDKIGSAAREIASFLKLLYCNEYTDVSGAHQPLC
jgi:hypothetical protein